MLKRLLVGVVALSCVAPSIARGADKIDPKLATMTKVMVVAVDPLDADSIVAAPASVSTCPRRCRC